MSFTYSFATAPDISTVRLLCSDTTPPGIFQDDEVTAALFIESSQGLYVSGQASSSAMNVQIPSVPQVYSYRRAAALLLDSIAAQLAQTAAATRILDVTLDCKSAAQEARASAKALRDTEANSGQFAIAEMVSSPFAARQRVWSQLLRISA
jgi:hypothetical protein